MAISNSERIRKILDLLREGLQPFVERRLKAAWKKDWPSRLRQTDRHIDGQGNQPIHWDSHLLLKTLGHRWDDAFRMELGRGIRTTAFALLEVRNRYAHESSFDSRDTLKALWEACTLLEAVSARKQHVDARRMHDELMRTIVSDQNRERHRRKDIHVGPSKGSAWRSVVVPHTDVLANTFTEAEFAADLAQVTRGEARAEYGDPGAFFRRTFLTEGLKALLSSAARRFAGQGGDPVVELQTGFGGGKTHSMLALFHMSGEGSAAKDLQGVDDLLRDLGLANLPNIRRAVFVGTMRGPNETVTKEDGTTVNTIWGEIAWQLGGRQGYKLVEAADQGGTAPGSETLAHLLRTTGPCLLLIDEWIAFMRQLYHLADQPPAGSFDANLTFVQSLTEAARAVPNAVLVASLPESDTEIGGEGGTAALRHLESTFGRMESPWRPATPDESFEIARRRLFEPIDDPQKLRERDRIIQAFMQTYRAAKQEFPPDCGEKDYQIRMEKAYPIHPLLFDQLYQEWGSLDRFQRTRGVLRMIAAIVRTLWETSSEARLILPAFVPLGNSTVQAEVLKNLDQNWTAVLEKDVDSDNSVPHGIDMEITNLGRYSATCRVARCIFMGTAPTFETGSHPGMDEKQIRLGCTQPGEVHQSYSDALRRLSGKSTYMYQDGSRVWFATRPSVNKMAEDRAGTYTEEDISAKIGEYLRSLTGRGQFTAVHTAPMHTADVPDEDRARLVVLGPHPDQQFISSDAQNPAQEACRAILLQRGDAVQRRYRNMLVFLAADQARMSALQDAVRYLLAWESIVDESESLALDAQQSRLAHRRKAEQESSVQARIPEAWCRVLRPVKADADGKVEWQTFHIRGDGMLADRVDQRLIQDEQLMTRLGPRRLSMILEQYDLWRTQPHVSTQRIWEVLCSFLYMPRLRERGVLLDAIKSAVTRLQNEDFAYAKQFDPAQGRYEGLAIEGDADLPITLDDQSLLVKLDVARAQIEQEAQRKREEQEKHKKTDVSEFPDPDDQFQHVQSPLGRPQPAPVQRRFFGTMEADPERLQRDANSIVEEVLTHIISKPGVKVKVNIEIQATVPDGFGEDEMRIVRENCQSLRFYQAGFEEN